MPTYIYRCPKCQAKVEMVCHLKEKLPSFQCVICRVDMKIEIQPVHFEVRGKFTADTGYSSQIKEEG